MANTVLRQSDDPSLYERDFFEWTQEQARAARERRFADLDIDNIAEELEALGRSDKREIESRIRVILLHLLKWCYQPDMRSTSWTGTLLEQRHRVAKLIKESPSLAGYPAKIVAEEYEFARYAAADETGLPVDIFAVACPFETSDILRRDFLPVTTKLVSGKQTD